MDRIFDQSQSPLFANLPPEIRLLIFEKALGGHGLHIREDPEDLSHESKYSKRLCTQGSKIPSDNCCPGGVEHDVRRIHLLALPLSCQRVCGESIQFIYSHNTFRFKSFDVFRRFSKKFIKEKAENHKQAFYFRYLQIDRGLFYTSEVHIQQAFSALQVLALPVIFIEDFFNNRPVLFYGDPDCDLDILLHLRGLKELYIYFRGVRDEKCQSLEKAWREVVYAPKSQVQSLLMTMEERKKAMEALIKRAKEIYANR